MTVELLPELTDEQSMLVDVSIRFMDAEVPMSATRARADGATLDDVAYRRAAADLGWFGLLARAEHGGGAISGNGLVDAALIASERGARLQPGPFVGHSVVVHTLSNAGVASSVLTALISGDTWATWADVDPGTCTLSVASEGLRLDGAADIVAEGDGCRWLLVTADGPDGVSQVLVDTAAQGTSIRRLEALDVSRHWVAIDFDGVAIDTNAIIGSPGVETETVVRGQRQIAAVLNAAEAVGAMHADLGLAVQYAKDRIAFGRPIGSFQAIKHLLADDSLWLEMAKGIVAAAATALGDRQEDGPQLAHAAKAFVAERGVEVAHDCFQVFGGIGYTWEHDQHFFLRRITADAADFGSAAQHRSALLDAAGVER